MNDVDLGIWGKLTRAAIFLLLVAFLMLVFAWYLPLIRDNERYRQKLQSLKAENQKMGEENKQLREQMEALRNDPQTIELLAREFGYVKAGETIFRFEPASTNRAAAVNP